MPGRWRRTKRWRCWSGGRCSRGGKISYRPAKGFERQEGPTVRQFCVAGSRIGSVDRLFAVLPKGAVSAVQQIPAQGIALLLLMLAVLAVPHLSGQTSVTLRTGGVSPGVLTFDGTYL